DDQSQRVALDFVLEGSVKSLQLSVEAQHRARTIQVDLPAVYDEVIELWHFLRFLVPLGKRRQSNIEEPSARSAAHDHHVQTGLAILHPSAQRRHFQLAFTDADEYER